MTDDVGHLFIGLLTSHLSSLVKYSAHLTILNGGCLSSYYWIGSDGFTILGCCQVRGRFFWFSSTFFIFDFGTKYSWTNSPTQVKLALPNTCWNGSLFRRGRWPCEWMLVTRSSALPWVLVRHWTFFEGHFQFGDFQSCSRTFPSLILPSIWRGFLLFSFILI